MFEKDDFLTKEMKKAKKYPLKTKPSYGLAILCVVAVILMSISLPRKNATVGDKVEIYGTFFIAFCCFCSTFIQYFFTEEKIKKKILGITIREVSKRDIMQIGVVLHSYGRKYLLIVLQTAPQYIPNRSVRYSENYTIKNYREIIKLVYKSEYDEMIHTFYGEYDFFEKSESEKQPKMKNDR